MGSIPKGEMSEDHNNTILRVGYNIAEKYLKLHRKLGIRFTLSS